MPLKPRELVDQGYYHIIGRGNNKLSLFMVPNGLSYFKNILIQSKKVYSWKIFHYCLMSNHFHLLCQVRHGEDLPKIMKTCLLQYSHWYRAQKEYVGYLWQGRYKSFLIQKESYLLECGRYIERNPVRAMIASRPEEYRWSSFRYYALGETDELVDEDLYYADLSRLPEKRRELYSHFVRLDNPYEAILEEALN